MKRYNISFVFPMYNEADNIKDTIERATGLAKEICDDYEIVVADDASTDGSGEIVEAIASRDSHVKSVRLKKNTKFGGALAAGLKNASKDIVLYTDSDFPAKEEDMKKAIELLDTADIVTVYSLVIKDATFKRIVISKVYNFLVRLLFRLKIRDANSGLKVYKRDAIKDMDLKSKSPFVDVEIFSKALEKGLKIKQYGLVFDLRTKGTSTISRFGVVVRTFWDMLAYKFKI